MSALPLNNLSEAFETAQMKTPTEQRENPQAYDQNVAYVQHVKASRHMLGLVGGNEVSGIRGNAVDLESDLLGITRPTTRGNFRLHAPLYVDQSKIVRENPKVGHLTLNISPVHLPSYQMWAYPATFAPPAFKAEACKRPEKF